MDPSRWYHRWSRRIPLVTVILSALCLSKVETGVRTFVGVALTVAGVVLLIVG